GRKEHAAVFRADGDGSLASGHAARVDVIGEPLREPGRATLPPALTVEGASVESRPPTVMPGGRAQDDRIAGNGYRAAVVSVEAVILPCPGVATVAADAEAVVSGHEHKTRVAGRGMHLMDVVLDVEERLPARTGVSRPEHTADVDVDVHGAVARGADRSDVGPRAPGRVAGIAAFRPTEGRDRCQPFVVEAQQMGARGPDKQASRRRRQARGLSAAGGRDGRPALTRTPPQLPAVDDGPRTSAVRFQR